LFCGVEASVADSLGVGIYTDNKGCLVTSEASSEVTGPAASIQDSVSRAWPKVVSHQMIFPFPYPLAAGCVIPMIVLLEISRCHLEHI
jgi:hypothetical protein